MKMEAIKLLLDWGWPVIDQRKELADNASRIATFFNNYSDIHFVGTGSSGAMIAGALACSMTRHPITIFPKEGIKSSTFRQPRFRDSNIVIIDDHIHRGRTLLFLNEALQEQSRIFHQDYISQVMFVVANEWNKEYPDETTGRNENEIKEGSDLIEGIFPFCQYWIH